jgi:5-methylcytosine-specific restriction protein A
MPRQAPRFGQPSGPRRAWAVAVGVPDRRLRGRAGVKQRAEVRREEPLCRICLAHGRTSATTQVDHIRSLASGGSNDRSNLQGLCGDCHDAKSKAERAEARRP